ncbi:MAG: GNAT family N-acetyltransferase [Solirubrobacterales bacterium]|nr:GNAT family N-acetyltransferase [Solirubrobacterales bacterium]
MAATRTDQLLIRPMREADLDDVAELSARAFLVDLDAPPPPGSAGLSVRESWTRRLAHPLRTDPEGAFIAERDGQLIGVTQALARENLWVLSLLAIHPRAQSGGAGRGLLAQALGYHADAERGLIVASNDPRALRAYTLTGFMALPCFSATGSVNRDKLRAVRTADIVELHYGDDLTGLDALTREVRGAPYGADLSVLLELKARLLHIPDRGFALLGRHGVDALVARDREAATRLLWHGLAEAPAGTNVSLRWLTAQQQWAIQAALQLGLKLEADCALMVRGHPGTLAPFIPTGPFA